MVGLTDHLFHDYDETKAARRQADLQDMLRFAIDRGSASMEKTVRETMEREPFNQRLWKREADAWAKFAEENLTHRQLDRWLLVSVATVFPKSPT